MKLETYKRYPPQYWVVISLELFERGAYYGIMGWFPVHAIYNLGFSGTVYGAMYALLVALLYFVPIIAASLARKLGYRKILLGAFILLIPTYFAMTFLRSDTAFFFAIVAWGVGAGAFKPMVSATIAHVTEKEFTVGKCTGTGITDTYFFTNQIFDAVDSGTFSGYQLCRCTIKPCNSQNIFIFLGIIFHHPVAAKINMSGINNTHLLSAGICFS